MKRKNANRTMPSEHDELFRQINEETIILLAKNMKDALARHNKQMKAISKLLKIKKCKSKHSSVATLTIRF